MLAREMHLFIKSLYTCHVSPCIVGEFYLMSAADTFCLPIEISHIDRTSDLSCYRVETGFPSFYRFSCAFRCKCEMHNLLSLHLLDDAQRHSAALLPVYRNSAKLSEKPSERTPEQFSRDLAIWISAY